MRVSFKQHFYTINPLYGSIKIKTDNEKQLGEKPALEYINKYNETQVVTDLLKDKKDLYYSNVTWSEKKGPLKYKFKYHDTGKVDDKNGDYYSLDYTKLVDKAVEYNHKIQGLKKILTLSHGKTTGKLVSPKTFEETEEFGKDTKTPYILLVKDFSGIYPAMLPKNITGLISLGGNFSTLSHQSANIKARTDASAFLTDETMFKDFEKHLGKYVELETANDFVNIKEINKSQVHFNKKIQNVNIPKLRPVDKLLSSSEYSLDTVGAKAVNLKKLEKLKKDGKIDVIIPPSFAIPYAYLDAMREENTKWQTRKKANYLKNLKDKDLSYYNTVNLHDSQRLQYDYAKSDKRMSEIMSMIEKTGIKGERVMIRSAFNGEDLDNYSAAGLYDSFDDKINAESIYNSIYEVAASKWNNRAVFSREEHNIPHENIQPTVIIQQHEPCDYTFTMYTNDEDGNVRIEMFSKYTKEHRLFNNPVSPNIFVYDAKTGEIRVEQKENVSRDITFDENLNIVDVGKLDNPIFDNFGNFKSVLERIIQNAKTVERELGKPQDIEGGITFGDDKKLDDEKVFFWQTRNIVYKNPEAKLKIAQEEFSSSVSDRIDENKFNSVLDDYIEQIVSYGRKKGYETLIYDEIPNRLLGMYYSSLATGEIKKNNAKNIAAKMIDFTNNRIALQRRFDEKAKLTDCGRPSINFEDTLSMALEDAIKASGQNRKVKITNKNLADELEQGYSYFYNYDAFFETVQNAINTSPKNSEIEINFKTIIKTFSDKSIPYTAVSVKSKIDNSVQNVKKITEDNIQRIKNTFNEYEIKENKDSLTVEFMPRI